MFKEKRIGIIEVPRSGPGINLVMAAEMNKRKDERIYFIPNETSEMLLVYLEIFKRILKLKCLWSINTPEVSLKVLISEQIYDDFKILNGLKKRINDLNGEWIGIDAALWSIQEYSRTQDYEMATFLKFLVQDEISHVAMGNKWIKYFCREKKINIKEVHQQALSVRNKHGDSINKGPLKFPFNKWPCENLFFQKKKFKN